MTASVVVWTMDGERTTVKNVVHAETEFGDENTIRLETPNGVEYFRGPGAQITGFTEEADT